MPNAAPARAPARSIDRVRFFAGIRQGPFPGKLTADQVSGCEHILDEWERRGLTDLRWLAYILATVKWETDHTMQPIREGGGLKYLKSKKYYPWYGRGYVQLTWQANYKKFRDRVFKLFGVDICVDPDLAMKLNVAAFIMFEGMIGGEFTARSWRTISAPRWPTGSGRAGSSTVLIARPRSPQWQKQFYADLVAAS